MLLPGIGEVLVAQHPERAGGVATMREALRRQYIGRMHIGQSPVPLGSGEALFAGLDLKALGYAVTSKTPSEAAMHLVIERQPV